MTDIENVKYQKALEFATKKHKGQYRKGGEEYIVHPVAVAQMVAQKGYGIDYQITALFHDLLEDTDASESEILELSNADVLKAVKLLTKQFGYDMSTYVSNIRNNKIAFVVKGADRLHNLQTAFCTDKNFKLKYIAETEKWYMDFEENIPKAVEAIKVTL